MSAPETNALSPLPASTTTRIAASAAKSSSTGGIACHISSDTALRRSGLSNTSQPTAPSRRAAMRPLISSLLSHHALRAQPGDIGVAVLELVQDLLRVLADLRRRGLQRGRRARELHRLAQDLVAPEARMIHFGGDAEVLHLRVREDFVHLVDRTARHTDAVKRFD